MRKLSSLVSDTAILPTNIKPNVMVTVARDNMDRLEESFTVGGTSHRVNGITVPAPVYGPDPPPNHSHVRSK